MRNQSHLSAVFALAACALLPAQQPDPKLGALAGRTVNSVTRQPVAKVNVTLSQVGRAPGQTAPQTARTATTDTQGRFDFENLAPGRYTLSAQRDDGRWLGNYGARAWGEPGAVVTLEPGQERKDLEFRVVPLGAIAGKVVDQNGESVRRVTLLFTEIGLYGEQQVTSGHTYLTNDQGEFRMYDLPPGKYCLLAVPPSVPRGSPAATVAERKHTAALPTYYPAAPDLASAAPVDLLPGQELPGVRITLREGPVFHVRGTIAGEMPGIPLVDLTLMLFPPDFPINLDQGVTEVLAERFGNPRAVAPDGTFDLANVEPGAYDLVAMRLNSRQRGPFGRTEVVVSDQGVKDVVLLLGGTAKLSVAVSVEGQEKANVSGVLMLWPLDHNLFSMVDGSLDNTGHAQIDGILPGQYRADVRTRLQGVYVKSLRLGDRDVLQTGLDLDGSNSRATLKWFLPPTGAR